jgi:hypothetical protein
VKAYAPGFPDSVHPLAQSPEFSMEPKSCGRPILVIPGSL